MRFKDATKTALAMVIAYGVALAMDWEKPMWAAFAVAFISLATVGQSVNKGIMRLVGTLLGAVFSLTLVALFPNQRWWFMLILSTFVGLCTYLMGGSKRQYLWNVAGFVSVIICMESVAMAGKTFDIAVLRTLETGLGILSYTLVTLLVWPSRTADELDAAVQRLVSTQHQLYHRYRLLLKDVDEAEDTQSLRTGVVQQFNQFSQMLIGARVDGYEVWESRRQWSCLQVGLKQLTETLECWRASFNEVRELDLTRLLPGLRELGQEVDGRFAQIERMLGGEAPERFPAALDVPLNTEAARGLSHFDKAALAVSRAQLQRLESLTRALFETLADIKGFAPSSCQADLAVAPESLFVPDIDRTSAAIRVVAGLWLAYLLWIYVEVPGGVGLVILAGSLGMALATRAQIPMSLLYKPAAVSMVFASFVYMFMMPQLSSFYELGLLIFAVTFAICYLFHAPQQILGRVLGLAMFVMMAGISNEQTYSFLHVANTALMFLLVLALLAFAAHIPVSPQPEKAYLNLLRRFFGSCGYLVSASRRESHGASRWLKRRREAYHLQQVALLPQKLAGWSRSVDSRLCPGSTAPQLQSVTAAVEVLGYRMHETLDARATPHSAAIARAVQSEIHAWRTGLREVFQCLDKEPETADQASFRARLDARLDSLEAHMERAIDRADATAISEAEAENGYRLLGAHRGISEALIDFSRRAAAIDWPCLRAARF